MLTLETLPYETIADSFIRHHGLLRNYIKMRLPEGYDAEDIVQDLFLKLLEKNVRIDAEGACSLLLTMAHNLLTDIYRRNSRKNEVLEYWERQYASKAERTVEEGLVSKELSDYYDRQVASLSERRKAIYEMMEYNGLTAEQVAASLSISKRTVENSIYTARQYIRTAMERYLRAS